MSNGWAVAVKYLQAFSILLVAGAVLWRTQTSLMDDGTDAGILPILMAVAMTLFLVLIAVVVALGNVEGSAGTD